MDETPLEKYRNGGLGSLSSIELIALAISRDGDDGGSALPTAHRLVTTHGGVRALCSMAPEILEAETGLRGLDAIRFLGLIELGRRAGGSRRGDMPVIENPGDIAEQFEDLIGERKEHFCILLLDTKNRVIKKKVVHIGTVTASLVGMREVFREAVREGATSLVAVHNHPSGDPTPSPEDFKITKLLAEAGKLLEIPLLDHVIIGDREYFSMQEHGAIG